MGLRVLTVVAIIGAMLAGCDTSRPDVLTPEQTLARARTLMPSEAKLAELYSQSCKTCHAASESGAPLAGDRAAWDTRYAKGMPALLQSTVSGLNGMPAGGQCFSCTPEDYEALINFMAGRN